MKAVSLCGVFALGAAASVGWCQFDPDIGNIGFGGGVPDPTIQLVACDARDVTVTFETEFGQSTVRGALVGMPKGPFLSRLDKAGGKTEALFSLAHVYSLRYTRDVQGRLCQAKLLDGTQVSQRVPAEKYNQFGRGLGGPRTLTAETTGELVVESPALGRCVIDASSVMEYQVTPQETAVLKWPEGTLQLSLGKAEVEIRELASIVKFARRYTDRDAVTLELATGEKLAGRVTKWPEGAIRFTVGGKTHELKLRDFALIDATAPAKTAAVAPRPIGNLGGGGSGGNWGGAF